MNVQFRHRKVIHIVKQNFGGVDYTWCEMACFPEKDTYTEEKATCKNCIRVKENVKPKVESYVWFNPEIDQWVVEITIFSASGPHYIKKTCATNAYAEFMKTCTTSENED